jgi:hypothetical protein
VVSGEAVALVDPLGTVELLLEAVRDAADVVGWPAEVELPQAVIVASRAVPRAAPATRADIDNGVDAMLFPPEMRREIT